MICTVAMSSGGMIYTPSFTHTDSGIQKLLGGIYLQAQKGR
jgi:hypothetical protein